MSEYRNDARRAEGEFYWTLPRAFGAALAALVVIYALGFFATGGDLAIYRFWAPKRANAERVVFENTQGYVQGKAQYLARLRYQYQAADTPEARKALRDLILSEAATVDNAKLPGDLAGFIRSLGEAS